MRKYIIQIILTTGLFLVFISFLFFGRQTDTYLLLLICGQFISLLSYLSLLFSKKTSKTKLTWTLVVTLAAGLHYITEPLLIKSSYLIYVYSNSEELKAINDILISHDGEIDIGLNNIMAKNSQLTTQEIQKLKVLRKEVGAYIIWKTNSDIYYGLYGFLDVRHGVAFVYNGDKPTTQLVNKHLTGNWYY